MKCIELQLDNNLQTVWLAKSGNQFAKQNTLEHISKFENSGLGHFWKIFQRDDDVDGENPKNHENY